MLNSEALERLRKLRSKVMARNKVLSPEEGDAIADRFAHEFVEDLATQRKIRFGPEHR